MRVSVYSCSVIWSWRRLVITRRTHTPIHHSHEQQPRAKLFVILILRDSSFLIQMFGLAAENLHSLINETLIPITPTQNLLTISAHQHFTWSLKFLMQFNINNVSQHWQAAHLGSRDFRESVPGEADTDLTPSLITGRVCIIILRSASPDISQCQHCPCVGISGPSPPLGTCFDCFCPDLTSAVIKFNYSPLTPQPVCWSQGIYHVRRDLRWRRGFCGEIFICFDGCYDLTLTPSWQSLGSREIWTLIRDHCNFHFIP